MSFSMTANKLFTGLRAGFFFTLSLPLLSSCGSSGNSSGVAEDNPPPLPVSVVTVRAAPHPLYAELPGRVAAFRMSEVRPQVSGIVEKRLFEEGADVQAGDLLYRIDDASYRAVYKQRLADLAVAQASLVNLRISVDRYAQLVGSEGVSQHEYELAQAAFAQGEAQVKAAEAAVEAARIDLTRTEIRAPINGRIGRSSVTEGALVTVGQDEPLATIQQPDPVYVDIVQSSQEQVRNKRRLIRGDLLPGDRGVGLLLEDGAAYEFSGELKFSEMNVDADTGVVTLRAQFPNPHGLLLPGMYVRAKISQGTEPAAMRVPQQAVRYNGKGEATAWVINPAGEAELRYPEIISAAGDDWLVRSGMADGEAVVMEGSLKLWPGRTVDISSHELAGGSAGSRVQP